MRGEDPGEGGERDTSDRRDSSHASDGPDDSASPGGRATPDDLPVDLPIDGTLDLHTFHPREVKTLVPEYLAACRQRGILNVRIVHGKGTGALRETVHAVLRRLPEVESFRLADEGGGSWGATLVVLKR
jgi:dsDNA-specific endonuclease/ATPase MutS2